MDLHAVGCALLLLTCTAGCFGQEVLLPERINKGIGENVVITPIRIPALPHILVRWRFNATTILTGPPGGIQVQPPYTGRVSMDDTTLALDLRSLTENDTGQYSLTVDTTTNPFTGETSLRMFVPVSGVTIVQSETQLVEFNSTVSLGCSANGSSLSFNWLNGSSELTAGERVELTDNNSTLTITSLLRSDTGPYQCEVSNSISKDKSSLNLTIYYGPGNVAVEADILGPLYSSGSNLTLTCSAESSPAAVYHWAVNGTELGEMGQELKLNNIQSSQSGSYTCIAHNMQTLRYSTSEPITITVAEKISGAALTGPTDALIEGVSSATLNCTASGTIQSTEWMKDNQKLSASENIIFSDDNRSVMIDPVSRRDSGVYQCTLINPVSSDTATHTVIVNFGPDNMIIEGPGEVEEGNTLTLSCHTDSIPNASYMWMFNGSSIGMGTAVYTVEEVSFIHTGTYTCKASNHITGREASGSRALVVKEKGSLSGGGESLSAGAIAGIVIGVLLGVAGIAGLIFYFVKGKKTPAITSRGNKQNGTTPNAVQHELHYADISHLRHNQKEQGMSNTPAPSQVPRRNQTATANPAAQTIYSDVRNL